MKPFFSGRVKLYLTYSMPNILCRVELHLNWFSETCSVILSECNFSQRKLPELGTRQHCRDSVTMFSGHKIIIHCLYSFGRRYLNFLPCCRCHEAKQLSRAHSSGNYTEMCFHWHEIAPYLIQ